MKIWVFYTASSLYRRLKKAGIMKKEETTVSDYSTGYFTFKRDPSLAYVELKSLIDPLPGLVKGLKIQRISLHDMLPLEQNPHISQAQGKFGESRYEVSRGIEKYTGQVGQFSSTDAFRAVVRIKIRGNNLQSVMDCYDKIRKGEHADEWKGSAEILPYCSRQTPPSDEMMY